MSMTGLTRRALLKSGIATGASAAVTGTALAQDGGDPLITETQDWAIYTGDPVDATPYGLPIRFEADVIRRNVPWLTADPISSINFTPIHALDGSKQGDLLCRISVETPVNLSSRQKELLREFEEVSKTDTNPESSSFFSAVKNFWDSMKS